MQAVLRTAHEGKSGTIRFGDPRYWRATASGNDEIRYYTVQYAPCRFARIKRPGLIRFAFGGDPLNGLFDQFIAGGNIELGFYTGSVRFDRFDGDVHSFGNFAGG
jgi:hypothetical protein